MNANTRGTIYVKQDRVNERIDKFADYFLKLEENKETISRDNFKEFVKSIHLIITTELNEKGVERKWDLRT